MYIAIFILVILNLIVEFYKTPKLIKRILNVLTIIILVLFASLRYKVGYDYDLYVNIYERLNNFSVVEYSTIHGEYLFLSILTLFKKIGLPPQIIFIFFPAAIFFLLCKSFKEYRVYFGVALFVYFTNYYFNSNFSQIRQGFAYVIVLYSIKYIINRDLYKFLSIIFIGSLIQSSALMFLPMYFLSRKIFSNTSMLLLIFLSIFTLKLDLVETLVQIVPLPEYLYKKVTDYLNHPGYVRNSIPFFGVTLRLLLVFIFYLFGRKIKDNELYQVSLYIYMYGVIFYFILGELTLISTRLMNLYGIVQIILFSEIIKINTKLNREIIITFMILLFTFIFIKTIYVDGKENFIPYQTILN